MMKGGGKVPGEGGRQAHEAGEPRAGGGKVSGEGGKTGARGRGTKGWGREGIR